MIIESTYENIVDGKTEELPIFSCHCDHCHELFEEPHEGFTFRFAEDNLIEDISNNDWITGSKKYDQGKDGEHYCPKCYKIDDEDKFSLLPKRKYHGKMSE